MRLIELEASKIKQLAPLEQLNDLQLREAVLYALRGLTGKSCGDSADEWRELLGIAKDKDAD